MKTLTFKLEQLEEMGKAELRAACKEVGVKNYGKMNNEGMRQAIRTEVLADNAEAVLNASNEWDWQNEDDFTEKDCFEAIEIEELQNEGLLADKENEKLTEYQEELVKHYGHTNCPHCNITLSNGVGEHGEIVNGTRIKHDEFQFVCLACDGEFGPKIKSPKARKPVQNPTGNKIEKNRPEQNGMKYPSTGTKTRVIWDLCDAMTKELGRPLKISELRERVAQGTNENMMKSQYSYWRKFHNITGRV